MTQLKTAVPGVTITATGLLVPDIADVLSGRLTDFDAAMGGGGSQSLSSPQGQIAQSDTEILATTYDALLCLFNQMNPDYATGRWQDGIGRLYFMERLSARGTVVTATCTGAVGTEIPAGSTAQDEAGYTYASISAATIGPSGQVALEFQNQTTGPIPCGVGHLNQIFVPVSGWDSITNEAAGFLGINVESRLAFETRRKQSVARGACNTDASTLAALLATEGVLDAYVWSNRTDQVVKLGSTDYPVTAHSLYVGVFGGTDAEVATAIFATKNPGANLNGDTTYRIEDRDHYSPPYPQYLMQWQRAVPLRVYFKIQIENDIINLPSDVTEKRGKPRPLGRGRIAQAPGRALMWVALIFNVLLNHFKRSAAHASRKVRRRPERIRFTRGSMQLRVIPFHLAATHPFHTVNQFADRHFRREVNQHMNMIAFPVKFLQLAFK